MNTGVQISLWDADFNSFWHIPRIGIAGLCGSFFHPSHSRHAALSLSAVFLATKQGSQAECMGIWKDNSRVDGRHDKWLLEHLTISLVLSKEGFFLSPVRSCTSCWAWNTLLLMQFLFAYLLVCIFFTQETWYVTFSSSSSSFFFYMYFLPFSLIFFLPWINFFLVTCISYPFSTQLSKALWVE